MKTNVAESTSKLKKLLSQKRCGWNVTVFISLMWIFNFYKLRIWLYLNYLCTSTFFTKDYNLLCTQIYNLLLNQTANSNDTTLALLCSVYGKNLPTYYYADCGPYGIGWLNYWTTTRPDQQSILFVRPRGGPIVPRGLLPVSLSCATVKS